MVNITQNIDDCVKSILEGDVVAFPTETVYGLGANIYDENAVNKIYKYKNRPKNLPLIVHVDSYEKMIKLVNIEDKHLIIFKHFISKLTPGPISFLLEKSDKVPDYITGNTSKVCIRIPSNNTAQEFLRKVNIPICAPSANLYNHVSSTTTKHIIDEFNDINFLVLEDIYKDENQNIGIESTIVEINFDTKNINILRPGFITPSIISSVAREYNFTYKYNDTFNVPGSSNKHYSINKDIYLIQNKDLITYIDKNNSSFIDFGCNLKNDELIFNKYYSLTNQENYIEAMQNLYPILRQAENNTSDNVYIYLPKNKNHFYYSLYDRIIKCVNNKIITNMNDIKNNIHDHNLK